MDCTLDVRLLYCYLFLSLQAFWSSHKITLKRLCVNDIFFLFSWTTHHFHFLYKYFIFMNDIILRDSDNTLTVIIIQCTEGLTITRQLRNECLFFSVHGIWIAVRNKQIAWTAKRFSCDLFVPHCDSYPMNREKKDTHSLYLQCLQQRPLLKFSEESKKFKFPAEIGHLTLFPDKTIIAYSFRQNSAWINGEKVVCCECFHTLKQY